MKKIGLIFDSSCGKSKKYVENKGGFFLPIEITINDQKYFSGETLDCITMSKILTENSKTSTAACSYGDINKIFSKAITKYDKVVYISLSKHLSSTNSTAKTVMKNEGFEGKIFVFDSNFGSPWLENIIDKLFEFANNNDLDNLINYLEQINNHIKCFITPKSLKFLHKGGRINKMQYILGSIAKVIPVISFTNGKFDVEVERFRAIEKAKNWVIEATLKKIEEFKSNDWLVDYKIIIMISPTENDEFESMKELLINKYKINEEKIIHHHLSPEIYAHIGPKYWGVALLPIF